MTFFPTTGIAPVRLPDGVRHLSTLYTGTACLSVIDSEVTGEVWEDLLYDGVDHAHGAGGLMLNSASVGTHLEHDGDFPVEFVSDDEGRVVGFRINLDPYAEDLADVREGGHSAERDHDDHHGHGHTHSHSHSHSEGQSHDHAHDHDHDHDHENRHVDGWSEPVEVRLVSDLAVLGDPAALPEADDTGDGMEVRFPARGGRLSLTVFSDGGLRRELVAVWTP